MKLREVWNRNYRSVETYFFSVFIFFCFFPYVNFLRLPTDAQPNALIIAVVIFCTGIRKYRYPRKSLIILLLIIPSYLLASIYQPSLDFSFFRSLLGYISLFFITLVSYISFKKGFNLSWYWFKMFVYLNIIVSILQTVLKVNFIEFLFYRVGMSDTRGVTGFTPEPTFNATIAIFCASLYLINYYNKRRNYILILIFVWIVFLAQSSTILLMAVPVIILYLTFKNFKIFVIPLIFLTVGFFLVFNNAEEQQETSRLVTILNVVASEPSKLITLDESVNSRVSNIIVPTYVSFADFLIPHGSNMSTLNRAIPIVTKDTFPNLFYFESLAAGVERIMSGWSMMFYEVGFIAFVFFIYILYLIFFKLDNCRVQFLGALLFVVILFTAVTVNTAIIPFIFGNIIYKALNKSDE